MIVAPMITLLWYTFTPDFGSQSLSFTNISEIARSPLYVRLLLKSVLTGGTASAVTVLIAWPSAWALSRISASSRNLILSLIIVPYLTSYLLLVYSMFVLLGSGGPLFGALRSLGLVGAGSGLLYTQVATVLVLIYEGLPIALFVLYSTSEQVTDDWLSAAASLGASPMRRFFSVVLPLSRQGLFTAFFLLFIPACGAFVEPQILGGPNGDLLGNVINDQLNTLSSPHFASALSMLLLVGIFAVVGALYGLQVLLRMAVERSDGRVSHA